MSTNQRLIALYAEDEPLRQRLQTILQNQHLHEQKALLAKLATDLAVNAVDLGAALLYVLQQESYTTVLPGQQVSVQAELPNRTGSGVNVPILETSLSPHFILPPIKMVRYRLDIGKKHQLTVKELKKVLAEESGVDKNNINNVMIHSQYTLVELPDGMPQDIFLHLKTVAINQQQLNIKRLKVRPKKISNRFRRTKPRMGQPGDALD